MTTGYFCHMYYRTWVCGTVRLSLGDGHCELILSYCSSPLRTNLGDNLILGCDDSNSNLFIQVSAYATYYPSCTKDIVMINNRYIIL